MADESNPKELTLRDVLKMLRKHLVFGVLIGLVVFCVVAGYGLLKPAEYTATSQVLASYSVKNASPDELSSGTTYLSSQIKTFPGLMKSQAVLKPVIDDLGLHASVSSLAKDIEVTNPPDTFLLNINVTTDNADTSLDVADSITKSFKKQVTSSAYGSSKSASASNFDFSVIQQAELSGSNKKTSVFKYLFVGLILGIIAGLIAALLREILAVHVNDSDTAETILGVRKMASLPSSPLYAEKTPVVISSPESLEAKAFLHVQNTIECFDADSEDDSGRLIIVASSQREEGRTTFAVNLAASAVSEGKSALLIEADDQPQIAERLDLNANSGLSDVLSQNASLIDCIKPYWKPNFHVLPAGSRLGDPDILASSRMMRELLKAACQQYDFVIVDVPPMSVSSAAVVLGKQADGVLMVVGNKICTRSGLTSSAGRFKSVEVPIRGFVWNFDDTEKKSEKPRSH
ncbi:polysaccharide biosynthesis tyrosine autokinase [Bifidobacterium sp. ESL0732]|uniref:polysaccharide biosynthesis tyrosine autokinase n=1 Tax=Bifidobacterium sp. ESL0732 TaxID=2983222 RepID=UPI0023F9BBAB|nr:polysaccharide biosynthesis tyrosine autokinase [Bifidobacterium sp. ESL0732]WEV64338.1 AAA family ATPase [Bifidobacterium sp. ESL0732]